MICNLTRSIDEALKQCKKKWDEVLSLRAFYCDEMDISGEVLTGAFAVEILKRTKYIPTMTGIPVSALGAKGDGLVACTLHVL
jgi:hypothetical protein